MDGCDLVCIKFEYPEVFMTTQLRDRSDPVMAEVNVVEMQGSLFGI